MDLNEALKIQADHPLVTAEQARETAAKATGFIQDGIFPHHKSFWYESDGYVYYRDFFGHGWNKRRPNADGWIKYQNAMAFNVLTGELRARREVL